MKASLILSAILILSGCYSRTYDFYYISLEHDEAARVVAREKLSVKNLRNNSIIPVEYSISRDKYTIRFLIGNSYSPSARITVEALNNEKLRITPKRDMTALSQNGTLCALSFYTGQDPSTAQFIWGSSCHSNEIRKVIAFDVIDAFGNIIASEDIPFAVIHDGEFSAIDGI
jgi:hypothetical protein